MGWRIGSHRQKERARCQCGSARREDCQGAAPRQVDEHAPGGAESGCRQSLIGERKFPQYEQCSKFDCVWRVPDGESEQAA